MERKRYTAEQIVAVLKQAEMGIPVAKLIRQVGISEQTFYRWKKAYRLRRLNRGDLPVSKLPESEEGVTAADSGDRPSRVRYGYRRTKSLKTSTTPFTPVTCPIQNPWD